MEGGNGGGWRNPGFMSPENLQRLRSGQMQGLPPGTSTDYRGNPGGGGALDDVGQMALNILRARGLGGSGQIQPQGQPFGGGQIQPQGQPFSGGPSGPGIGGPPMAGGAPYPAQIQGQGQPFGGGAPPGIQNKIGAPNGPPPQVLMMLMELFRRNQQKRQQQMMAQKMGRPF